MGVPLKSPNLSTITLWLFEGTPNFLIVCYRVDKQMQRIL
jgi:hypothetical protein